MKCVRTLIRASLAAAAPEAAPAPADEPKCSLSDLGFLKCVKSRAPKCVKSRAPEVRQVASTEAHTGVRSSISLVDRHAGSCDIFTHISFEPSN